MMGVEICPDCKVKLSVVQDKTKHAYLGASPSCWKLFGEVLAREYSDSSYMKFHRWTVDAYGAQHPGKPEPRTIQSINVHLLSLYLLIEKKVEPSYATKMMTKIIDAKKNEFVWLTPPENLGGITVAEVLKAASVAEHAELVKSWAEFVWRAWSVHHPAIRLLARSIDSQSKKMTKCSGQL